MLPNERRMTVWVLERDRSEGVDDARKDHSSVLVQRPPLSL
jgi:hypothetical protein